MKSLLRTAVYDYTNNNCGNVFVVFIITIIKLALHLGYIQFFSFLAIQAVLLNSTLERLRGEYVTYPQQRVYFTCTTTGANIQEWYSTEYITGTDDRIQLHTGRRSGSGREANATVIDITANELGETVIIAQLSLVASTQYPVSTVSCGNDGYVMRNNITFSK